MQFNKCYLEQLRRVVALLPETVSKFIYPIQATHKSVADAMSKAVEYIISEGSISSVVWSDIEYQILFYALAFSLPLSTSLNSAIIDYFRQCNKANPVDYFELLLIQSIELDEAREAKFIPSSRNQTRVVFETRLLDLWTSYLLENYDQVNGMPDSLKALLSSHLVTWTQSYDKRIHYFWVSEFMAIADEVLEHDKSASIKALKCMLTELRRYLYLKLTGAIDSIKTVVEYDSSNSVSKDSTVEELSEDAFKLHESILHAELPDTEPSKAEVCKICGEPIDMSKDYLVLQGKLLYKDGNIALGSTDGSNSYIHSTCIQKLVQHMQDYLVASYKAKISDLKAQLTEYENCLASISS